MRLLLSLAATVLADGHSLDELVGDWDPAESRIHLQFKGGLFNMVADNFNDFGYPLEFYQLAGNITDESAIAAMATWSTSTRSSFIRETTADRGLFSFYAGLLSAMKTNGESISRDELEAAVYTNFLAEVLAEVAQEDLDALVSGIVESYFDSTVQAAIDYYDLDNNMTYLEDRTKLTILRNVRSALNEYNRGIGLSVGLGSSLQNVADVAVPIVRELIYVIENQINIREVLEYYEENYFQEPLNAIIFDPLFMMCNGSGPFTALRVMAIQVYSYINYFNDILYFITEDQNLWSKIFFGEEGHAGIHVQEFLWHYFFVYFQELSPAGGMIENNLHLASLSIDPLIQPTFYELIKTSICGVAPDTATTAAPAPSA